MDNDSSNPQPQGERATGVHVCPDCGATFNDGTDYEDGDCCMPCMDKWFDEFFTKWKPAISAAAQLIRAKRTRNHDN